MIGGDSNSKASMYAWLLIAVVYFATVPWDDDKFSAITLGTACLLLAAKTSDIRRLRRQLEHRAAPPKGDER